ncbi:hypothetical protein GCM10025868_35350 [Angustibacter aerolatus]|uniref:Putative Flp pilus-assembly TadG-like N-terminal domain-containing protein n=1 Tax=Angustibacter aerolatus TaxID=1162965 RepID=A0ABQ6JNF2_9ACTN|nr:hypothetical protein GCM10025868_35350 [Angustibacter aerolatus]
MTGLRRRLAAARATEPDDRGAVTVFVLGLTVTLLALGGLVIDGGNRVNDEMTLADDTEQAARAGATAIDEEALRVGARWC